MWVWGQGSGGELGGKDASDRYWPTLLPGLPRGQVSSSADTGLDEGFYFLALFLEVVVVNQSHHLFTTVRSTLKLVTGAASMHDVLLPPVLKFEHQ